MGNFLSLLSYKSEKKTCVTNNVLHVFGSWCRWSNSDSVRTYWDAPITQTEICRLAPARYHDRSK